MRERRKEGTGREGGPALIIIILCVVLFVRTSTTTGYRLYVQIIEDGQLLPSLARATSCQLLVDDDVIGS